MKPEEFALLRRGLARDALLRLVDQIEQSFRHAMAHPYGSYSINSSDGGGRDITEAEYLRVCVIRACMAVGQADEETRNRAIDHLQMLLVEADPHRATGVAVMKGRAKGTKATKEAAAKRHAEIEKQLTENSGKVIAVAGERNERNLPASSDATISRVKKKMRSRKA